jgi:Oxidoreductase molybdopterin binding domain
MEDGQRLGPARVDPFPSPLHDERTAALLGIGLGVAFTVSFVTGLYSHYQQQQSDALFVIPAAPAGLYRVTQGLHIATGIATVPLLLAKLWTVLPRFFSLPPIRSIAHAVERLMLLPLVAGSLFMVFSGVGNIFYWRPWRFDFTTGHYWVAWITIGALVAHLGAKWTLTRRVVFAADPVAEPVPELQPEPGPAGALTRRGFLAAVGVTSGVLTVATLGQTVRPLQSVSVLAPRRPDTGPQGVPVNRTAGQAGVREAATAEGYALQVEWDGGSTLISLDELRRLPWTEAVLPIACVEGWSADGRWGGVALRDLATAVGRPESRVAVVHSLQEGRRFTSSRVNRRQFADPASLLALDLAGEPLHIDHGFPARLIVPNRPGVLQTKWLGRVVLS